MLPYWLDISLLPRALLSNGSPSGRANRDLVSPSTSMSRISDVWQIRTSLSETSSLNTQLPYDHTYGTYGRHFTLRIDHQALTALLVTTGSGHKPLRLYQWSERLQAYNFSTQFTPGRDNIAADLFSRATLVTVSVILNMTAEHPTALQSYIPHCNWQLSGPVDVGK